MRARKIIYGLDSYIRGYHEKNDGIWPSLFLYLIIEVVKYAIIAKEVFLGKGHIFEPSVPMNELLVPGSSLEPLLCKEKRAINFRAKFFIKHRKKTFPLSPSLDETW